MKTINIEIVLKEYTNQKQLIINLVNLYLDKHPVSPGSIISKFGEHNEKMSELIECLIIEELDDNKETYINLSNFKIKWHVYNLNYEGSVNQREENLADGETINCASHLVVPNVELLSSWENLHYEVGIKENLLNYAQTLLNYGNRGVDMNVVSYNKVILLHGPPGTGKTSLCKALAQKLSIRLCDQYSSGLIIDINSHSLFSKWFSESGKLVTKMFTSIQEIIENPSILVCVIIDEVESLAHARDQCMSGVEPSDSIRVVNAVLTQIDQIKKHPNVLIFATSNLTKSIDLAFVDRADIKQYLGPPSLNAIYKIYYSCVNELIRVGIINSKCSLDPLFKLNENVNLCTKTLLEICKRSSGLSGRSLRKIPFLACALFANQREMMDLEEFLEALSKAVSKEMHDRKTFNEKPSV